MDSQTLSQVVGIIFIIVLDIISLCFVWRSAREWGISGLLDADGNHVEARIINRRTEAPRHARCLVTYRFTILSSKHQRLAYENEQQVSWRHINRIKIGDEVEVSYLPNYPKTSKLTGVHVDNSLRDNWTMLAVIGMLIFPFPPLILVIWLAFFLDKRFGIVSAKR